MTLEALPSGEPASREWVDRYLALLGIDHPGPSLEALTRLTHSHVRTILFTNVPAIHRRRAHPSGPVPPIDLDALLQSWEHYRGGGVCFEVAEMFSRLLVALGYHAHSVLAQISFPGSHQAVVVELDGRSYLADVSNGAPFFEPIPLDGTGEICRFGLAYRFRPGEAAGHWVQERVIQGTWQLFCRYDLRPPHSSECEAAYQRHHTPGESWVVDDLRLIQCREDAVFPLRNGRLTRFTAEGKDDEAITAAGAARIAAEVFGMPDLPVAAAVEALTERMSAGR
jgi:N-hydroxyarylamine O-acetyltransferase